MSYKNKNDKDKSYIGFIIGCGLILGTIFGVLLLDNMLVGVGIGIALGAQIGLIIDKRNPNNKQHN